MSVDSEVRPLVSLSPNWVPLLTEDFIQLTCDLASTQGWKQTFYWYKDGESLEWNQKSLIVSADEEDSGSYQCQTDASERSDPLRLDVRNDFLILQTPPAVHEGDFLKLRCHSRSGYNEINTTFYKDRNIIQSLITDSVSHLGRANISASGKYRCEKQIYFNKLHYNLSAEVNISISELFSTPQIKVSPDQVTEGDHMIITCDTKLSPHRATTELQFVFYRNGHNVQGFHISSNFTISSVHHMDSGNYTCEVQTPTGSVRKMSKGTYIQMHGRTALENKIRLGFSGLLLFIILWLLFHRLKPHREVYSEKEEEKECSIPL
ncbi:high affinity immunoglobulin gamma Fc receptor I-like [Xenopus laevis]|uniref:high affinity immunoglobulin gamma Fc receptor I-like n=1 Tax=Xenopus laevis TaxID=8355 RepID=UPI001BB293B5|nr:high affinity immunoglobulin gamma Fc receptor I-like [Xenopus laevis]